MPRKIQLPLLLSALCAPLTALAYVGPGAGLSAIGAALALIGAILLGIVGFLWYPIKRLMKRRKAADSGDGEKSGAKDGLDKQQTPEPAENRQSEGQ